MLVGFVRSVGSERTYLYAFKMDGRSVPGSEWPIRQSCVPYCSYGYHVEIRFFLRNLAEKSFPNLVNPFRVNGAKPGCQEVPALTAGNHAR
jgi:hypothetical protein